MKYTITIEGCDAATRVIVEATDEEHSLLDAMCKRTKELTVRSNCSPSMEIREYHEGDKEGAEPWFTDSHLKT